MTHEGLANQRRNRGYARDVIPRFRDGEVVRVTRLGAGWDSESQSVIGHEGVVEHVAGPNLSGTGWQYGVWIVQPPHDGTLWGFDEDELESLGVRTTQTGDRVGIDALGPPDALHDRVELDLVTRTADRVAAEAIARSAHDALSKLIESGTVTVELESRPGHGDAEPFHVRIKVEAPAAGLKTFDSIVAPVGAGWMGKHDDGWFCEFYWSQDEKAETMFLTPEVIHAWIAVRPWDDPRRRSGPELRA